MTLARTAVRSMDMQFNKKSAGERATQPSNVRRIQNQNFKECVKDMSDGQAIWQLTKHLAYKHRVGLLATTAVAMAAYIAWEKVISIFV